ncbi:hypothetical protein D3C81_1563370 [compost metagenome]
MVDRALLQSAAVSVHELPEHALALQGSQQLGFKVEAADQRGRVDAQIIEAVAMPDPTVEHLVVLRRAQLLHRLDGLAGMAAGSIVNRDMKLEIMTVDAELGQLVGGDQQV